MDRLEENAQAENIKIDSDSELSSAPDDEIMLNDTSSYPTIEMTPSAQESHLQTTSTPRKPLQG